MTMNSIMKNLFGEYGLIIILIVVAMVGYLVVRGNEEDILARSLDGIRDRLVAMVDDEAAPGGRPGGPGSAYPPGWDSSTVPLSAAQMDSVLKVVSIPDSMRARVLRRLRRK